MEEKDSSSKECVSDNIGGADFPKKEELGSEKVDESSQEEEDGFNQQKDVQEFEDIEMTNDKGTTTMESEFLKDYQTDLELTRVKILKERLAILENMVQNDNNGSTFQALERAMLNMCRVVDAVMKKYMMVTISRQGKIKKKTKEKRE